jgi:RsiW-degrading membrane proteinase PrsW (M82 family)
MGGGYVRNSGRSTPSYSFSHLVPIRHWARDPTLRSWPVLLLVALVCVPPIGLVLLNNATEAKIHDAAWIFAAYFAVAWLLLLGVIVRPQHVSRAMLAAVAVVGIVTQAPIAIFLETQLHAGTSSLLDIFTIGVPEELAKAIPIVVVAWIWRRYWHTQTPRDYLFLGAVSGLVFGAAEVVHYFTDVLGHLSGNATGPVLQALTLEYVWRFLTDPIDHACWAGITGYFIGLAITGQHRHNYWIAPVGIGIAAVLHGLNDWNPINSHPAWVVVSLISVLLFLGYARAGAWLPPETLDAPADPAPPLPWAAHPDYGGRPGHAGPPSSADSRPPTVPRSATRPRPPAAREEWWQHAPAAAPPSPPAHPVPAPDRAGPPGRPGRPAAPSPAPATAAHEATPRDPATAPTVVQHKSRPKPWWEQ